ncbi:unnamed protein product [Parnassius apollo]|uniref:(apollo) hypothetical protein n=1 Tax=Parnassius apollo TaxID=110799 RepID=A0A8S3YAH5_PARAO|nr:unnamed protein product [Parnassius apollo]
MCERESATCQKRKAAAAGCERASAASRVGENSHLRTHRQLADVRARERYLPEKEGCGDGVRACERGVTRR